MGDVVNLRRARKSKARAADEMKADANRLRFGATATERRIERARAELEAHRLDGHKRSE
ncbi:DUF4169 family protein [Phreatobacter stygius]|uniref:DUF4169 family protein n=1 Tax=Phreatobacter stygius TaxID=1940610 RepID=A0A4D7B6F3_9HYPH|nr:DUF4169 family protein [Phreatobacter stygius]QCI65780.1 DUF4169 family protein [Phreatobacter stygius]